MTPFLSLVFDFFYSAENKHTPCSGEKITRTVTRDIGRNPCVWSSKQKTRIPLSWDMYHGQVWPLLKDTHVCRNTFSIDVCDMKDTHTYRTHSLVLYSLVMCSFSKFWTVGKNSEIPRTLFLAGSLFKSSFRDSFWSLKQITYYGTGREGGEYRRVS